MASSASMAGGVTASAAPESTESTSARMAVEVDEGVTIEVGQATLARHAQTGHVLELSRSQTGRNSRTGASGRPTREANTPKPPASTRPTPRWPGPGPRTLPRCPLPGRTRFPTRRPALPPRSGVRPAGRRCSPRPPRARGARSPRPRARPPSRRSQHPASVPPDRPSTGPSRTTGPRIAARPRRASTRPRRSQATTNSPLGAIAIDTAATPAFDTRRGRPNSPDGARVASFTTSDSPEALGTSRQAAAAAPSESAASSGVRMKLLAAVLITCGRPKRPPAEPR